MPYILEVCCDRTNATTFRVFSVWGRNAFFFLPVCFAPVPSLSVLHYRAVVYGFAPYQYFTAAPFTHHAVCSEFYWRLFFGFYCSWSIVQFPWELFAHPPCPATIVGESFYSLFWPAAGGYLQGAFAHAYGPFRDAPYLGRIRGSISGRSCLCGRLDPVYRADPGVYLTFGKYSYRDAARDGVVECLFSGTLHPLFPQRSGCPDIFSSC